MSISAMSGTAKAPVRHAIASGWMKLSLKGIAISMMIRAREANPESCGPAMPSHPARTLLLGSSIACVWGPVAGADRHGNHDA